MQPKIILIICLVVLLVVAINGVLILYLRSPNSIQQINLWKKAAHQARDPWKSEDKDLKELSRLVTALKKEEEEPGE